MSRDLEPLAFFRLLLVAPLSVGSAVARRFAFEVDLRTPAAFSRAVFCVRGAATFRVRVPFSFSRAAEDCSPSPQSCVPISASLFASMLQLPLRIPLA